MGFNVTINANTSFTNALLKCFETVTLSKISAGSPNSEKGISHFNRLILPKKDLSSPLQGFQNTIYII